jgi:hypothetical protein
MSPLSLPISKRIEHAPDFVSGLAASYYAASVLIKFHIPRQNKNTPKILLKLLYRSTQPFF